MITLREVTTSVFGAWRLAHLDAGGMAFLDTSVDGFWRSFWAAAVVAPLYIALMAARYATGGIEAGPARFLAVEAVAYAISWLAFPVAMLTLVEIIDRRERYIGYIVAYNWAAVIQNAIYLPVGLLALLDVIPAGPANLLGALVLGAIMVYLWFIARAALRVPGLTAAGLVVLDFLLSILINAVADSLH